MDSIYYTIYSLIGNALYGTLPEVGTATELALTLVSTVLAFSAVLFPFFVVYKVLCFIFNIGGRS